MITGIRQKTVVGEGGKVEILSPELPGGTLVDVIILVEPVKQLEFRLNAHFAGFWPNLPPHMVVAISDTPVYGGRLRLV